MFTCYCSKCIKKQYRTSRTLRGHIKKDKELLSRDDVLPTLKIHIASCISKTEDSLNRRPTSGTTAHNESASVKNADSDGGSPMSTASGNDISMNFPDCDLDLELVPEPETQRLGSEQMQIDFDQDERKLNSTSIFIPMFFSIQMYGRSWSYWYIN